jgi:hypothetical protein
LSDALDLWHSERRDEIHLSRDIASAALRRTSTEVAAANLHLASFVRVCCAEFQAFCADLFEEAIVAVKSELAPKVRTELVDFLVNQLSNQTNLSRGNPNSINLISDFGRLNVDVRKRRLVTVGPATEADITTIDTELLACRNELAHGGGRLDTITVGAGRRRVTLTRVNSWYQALDRTARTIDTVVAEDLTTPLGGLPW